MKEINNFLFAGGDTRQIYAGERLKKEGFGVSLLGFDLYSGEKPQKDFLRENGGILTPLFCLFLFQGTEKI